MTPWHQQTLGEGEQSFIWMHGWGQTGQSLSRLAQLFPKIGKHRLFDLPGFGKTPQLKEDAGTEDYADTLADLLKAENGGSHIFVGHSYGGRVAVQMAARHPELVKAVIIIAGAGLKRRRSLAFKLRAVMLRQLGKLARLSDRLFGTRYREAYSQRFGSSDYKSAGALRSTFVNAVTEDLTAAAKQIRVPTLLVYGAEDTETPPEIGRRYEQLIPIARYVELAGFGHLDILNRGAYQCEAVIKAFLKDLKDA